MALAVESALCLCVWLVATLGMDAWRGGEKESSASAASVQCGSQSSASVQCGSRSSDHAQRRGDTVRGGQRQRDGFKKGVSVFDRNSCSGLIAGACVGVLLLIVVVMRATGKGGGAFEATSTGSRETGGSLFANYAAVRPSEGTDTDTLTRTQTPSFYPPPPTPLLPLLLPTLRVLGGGLAPIATHTLLAGLPNTFTMVSGLLLFPQVMCFKCVCVC